MSLQATINIDIDFYNKKYVLINAKQLDRGSRFISVTCYNHGELCYVNAGEHAAYIRYKKPDNNSVFNLCEIDRFGKIMVELTEQMLSSDGICCADLVIVNKGNIVIDKNTSEITTIDGSVLSTMPLYIDVTGIAVENTEIESSYEFNALNDVLEKVEADYLNVVKTAKSYAEGNTGVRENENTSNAKYYWLQSLNNAAISKQNKDNALNNANKAQSYAVGGTGTRSNEDEDNAQYYYNLIKGLVGSIEGGFIPAGTISFSELTEVDKITGFIYNIKDDFITDDTFVEGAGKSYTAGTNVYCTNAGKWDCLGGSVPSMATVDEVKEYLDI